MSGSISASTLAATALATSVAGAGVSTYGSIQSASAQKASADYQAQVAAGNQATALQNASFAAASGEQQAAIQEQKTRANVGAIEASEGSSGVDINSPTASAIRTSAGELGALDAQTIRSNAARQAYGYETQSTNYENASSADTASGENAQVADNFNAGSGLLSSVGNESLNYAKIMGDATGLSDANNYINASPKDQVAYDVSQEP